MKLVFTLTPGRTGTLFLAELFRLNFPHAQVHHEILTYSSFGVDTPDLSQLTLFNSKGNVEKVRDFWSQKIDRILHIKENLYVETSHILMKAGLVENVINLISPLDEVHFVILKRDVFHTLLSYHNRFDFMNKGNQWLWYLDPDYPRNLLPAKLYMNSGIHGVRLWYIREIQLRAVYYKLMYEHLPNIHFHEYDLYDLNNEMHVLTLFEKIDKDTPHTTLAIPQRQNQGNAKLNISKEEKTFLKHMLVRIEFDPVTIARGLVRLQPR